MSDLPLPARINIDSVAEHSFKDMHVKGFHYLCLQRSEFETTKLYFFDGDVNKAPEVVAPHDHRYDFETYVAAGAVDNVWFRRTMSEEIGQIFNWFEYRTPLNGGNGFTFAGEEMLWEANRSRFTKGESYYMQADDLHTIRIAGSDTVLMLVQFEDVYPEGVPLRIQLAQPRSGPRHRLYRVILRIVVENTEKFSTEDALHKTLLVGCGVVEPVITPEADIIMCPSSTAFDAMREDEFKAYFDQAMQIITR
jgi:hypothetical protein